MAWPATAPTMKMGFLPRRRGQSASLAHIWQGAAHVRICRNRSRHRQRNLRRRSAGPARSLARSAIRTAPAEPVSGDHPDQWHRRRRQGRDGQVAQRMDGPAPDRGPHLRSANRRRTGAATGLALLADAPGQGPHGGILRQLVQPDAAGPGPRRVQGPKVRSRHQRRRTPGKNAVRRRCADLQVLVPPLQETNEGTSQGIGRRPAAQLAHQSAGLAAVAKPTTGS